MREDDDPGVLETFRQMAALQARVVYMNVDRTLSTWTRTALALIVFGTVVDRYGILLLYPHYIHEGTRLAPNPVSSAGGIFLVALGVYIVATAAIRHQGFCRKWNREYGLDRSFGPWLAFPFALGVVALGLAMLILLLAFAR